MIKSIEKTKFINSELNFVKTMRNIYKYEKNLYNILHTHIKYEHIFEN